MYLIKLSHTNRNHTKQQKRDYVFKALQKIAPLKAVKAAARDTATALNGIHLILNKKL